ncbi:MAG: hypothetical protein CM1200mP6_03790 [Anaerolineaceae bacterium]|nr:MAG: hypothetical protein CM1200mP6_03790 [Anaerolineaceae bacterium]
MQIHSLTESGVVVNPGDLEPIGLTTGELLGIPITVLYDRGTTFVKSAIMSSRISDPYVEINVGDALTQILLMGTWCHSL